MQDLMEKLQDKIVEAGKREGAQIRVANQMEARLSGRGFKIQAITPEVQAVSKANVTEWKWEIEAAKPGSQPLLLTLSALLQVEGERLPRAIRTFERTIEVRVTWPQRLSNFMVDNWQWLWTTLLVPIVGWIIQKWRRPNKKRKRERKLLPNKPTPEGRGPCCGSEKS
jgi:hypothetical protein